MNNLESNKIFAALLVAGIIAMLSGFIAEILTHPNDLGKDAIAIEDSDGGSDHRAQKEKLPEPILYLIANADVARGQKVSKACAACHSFTKGGSNGVGPNLWNSLGSNKQSKEGYSYSGTLTQQGGDIWTDAELNKYLYKPKKYAKGTKMNFIGLKKPEDRASVIAWLRTLADSPAPLPTQTQIDAENAELLPEVKEEDSVPNMTTEESSDTSH